MRILGPRVLIRKIEKNHTTKAGITWVGDKESLPLVEIVEIGLEVEDYFKGKKENPPQKGDLAYHLEPREKGKVIIDGEELFLVGVDTLAAIL